MDLVRSLIAEPTATLGVQSEFGGPVHAVQDVGVATDKRGRTVLVLRSYDLEKAASEAIAAAVTT